jgi:hypothetical protein
MLPVDDTEVVGCFWIRSYKESERNWLWLNLRFFLEFAWRDWKSQIPQDRSTNRNFNLVYPRFLNQLLLFHPHTIPHQYKLYWYSWCWRGSLEFLWLRTVMRHMNVVLLFVINCNYGMNFVDTSAHTQIINGNGLSWIVSVSGSS